jgi:hypothetical protein
MMHSNPSSGPLRQSSSSPLQVSGGGLHSSGEGRAQSGPQMPEPVDPQVVVQGVSASMGHSKPSSTSPLQLSSMPLQVSSSETKVQAVSHPGASSRSYHPSRHV